jgi:hypothetical protein
MSRRHRRVLASLAIAASLALAAPLAEALPMGFEPGILERLSALLDRAWSALVDERPPTSFWEKDGPCADPHGQPLPNCPARPAMSGEPEAPREY